MQAIIFDITGVLFPYQPWVGERPPKEKLSEIKKSVASIYDPAQISEAYLREKIFQLQFPPEEREAIFKSLTVIDRHLLELIKQLSLHYPLYIIANEAKKWTDIRKDLFGFQKYFKKLYISSEIGLKKPDPEIFKLFLTETGLAPEECLFIDDKVENIESAKQLGLHGHVYKNYEELEKYLTSMSILMKQVHLD